MRREWKTVEYSALLAPLNHTLYLRGSGIIVKEASGKIVRTGRTGCARCDSAIAHSELPVVVIACIRFTREQTSQSQHGWGQVWWSSPTSLGAIGHWWMLREGESVFFIFLSFFFMMQLLKAPVARSTRTQVYQVNSVEKEMDWSKRIYIHAWNF